MPRPFGLALLATVLAAPAIAQHPERDCLACHGRARLWIDPARFAESNHRNLGCADCHADGFAAFPHGGGGPLPDCLDCHGGNDADPNGVAFDDIAEGFRRSVHHREHPERFTCFQCHDPHVFRRWREVTPLSIAGQNRVCLSCHSSQEEYGRIVDKPVPDLARTHAWLPHREEHWAHVRCLDCHSSYQPPVGSHHILPASEAVRDCVSCHSANSVLRIKLYKHRRQEETARLGFANAAIVNDAYVIGATRNRLVDGTGGVLLGSTVLGILTHGTLRWLRRRRAGPRPRRDRSGGAP